MLWNKAAYDQALAARKQAKERVKQFDAKRKKLKEDLEAREEAYRKSCESAPKTKSDDEQIKVWSQFNFVIIHFLLLTDC